MRKDFLPFSKPSISEDDIKAVGDVLRSGWITTGPKNAEFENSFTKYAGCQGAVALASATAGMHLLLKALGIGPGDEVITPSMTWVSTVNLIVLSGAKPVFADIARNTLMVTPESLEKCVTERTKLAIPVHFAGAPADLDPIYEISRKHGFKIVEDAAHAVGTAYKNEMIGRRGTSIFSFHPIKNITTGEGGMFCSNDQELLTRIRQLKFHGLGVDAYDRQTFGRSPQAQVLEPGFKYNMTDISAVLGIRQLARVEEFNNKRRHLAALYREKLSGIGEIIPLSDPDYAFTHSWHLFIVRLDIEKSGMNRDEFMGELKKRNIGTGLHFRAAHLQKYYLDNMGGWKGRLPETEWNSERILSLPLFPDMHEEDVCDVVSAIKEILKNH
ncbi:MAG: aminotransferase class I/II-fold pyridoxal phosphate-dependent enzyme [Lentisphaerae bacterium]|nr:aminotransferase class I/II-fold pyridoxal phosphate-dependent enzyme [Lentisphaerota bacterium]